MWLVENQHVVSESCEFTGSGKAGETGSHHDDVGGPSRVGHAPQSTKRRLRDVIPR